MLSRRHLLGGAMALSASGLWLPRSALAQAEGSKRRFLFIVANGGWDTTYVFTPEFHNSNVDMESTATTATAHGLSFVDSESRPAVRNFFEIWGDQACIINGVEVRSVTHERCERILLTGTTGSNADDWPTLLAAHSPENLTLPHLVVYGSAFTHEYGSKVVRLGNNGQLASLLSGEALLQTGHSLEFFPPGAETLIDAHVRAQVEAATLGSEGRAARFASGYAESLDTLDQVIALAGELQLNPAETGCSRDPAEDAAAVFECFERGLSRCGMVQYDGWCSERWDTHANNSKQSTHFELLFGYLDRIMADLQTRSSPTGGALADEVVVVVLSEMGRHPRLNTGGGKDHWTFTSAMLLGAPVAGGRVIGAMDDDFQGRTIDLASGELSDSGVGLLPGHLGATLLAMADLDPAEFVMEDPILAAIR